VVLALPRGGVPVAAEVARVLAAPLDLLMVRKIGVPWQPELALGAVVDGDDPDVVVNEEILRRAGYSDEQIAPLAARALAEIERRQARYMGGRPALTVRGRTAIVVDDGIATGATVRAAVQALRRRGAARIVVAAPVAPRDVLDTLRTLADDVVCLATPEPFMAVGSAYRDFDQVDDETVVKLLDEAARRERP
jgi:predicted phosphoribosyltransferase